MLSPAISELCKECGKEISDQAEHCPNCGVPLKKQPGESKGRYIARALLIGAIILVWAGFTRQDSRNPAKTNTSKSTPQETKTAITNTSKQPPIPTRKVTKGGYPACISEEAFNESVNYAASKDYLAFHSLVESGECILLEDNIEVERENVRIFRGKIQIRPKGSRVKLWTSSEAVEDRPIK